MCNHWSQHALTVKGLQERGELLGKRLLRAAVWDGQLVGGSNVHRVDMDQLPGGMDNRLRHAVCRAAEGLGLDAILPQRPL